MPYVEANGVDFFYREAGHGSPLLLIHGAAGNADAWSPVFESLARDHRVIAYDRRAHTRSKAAPPAPAENYATHGEDAAGILRALAAAPATVVGWSAGGLTALHLASKHPGLVSGLVLEEAPYRVLGNLTPDAAETFRDIERLAGEGRLRDAAEVFLRFACSYRTGGTAFDRFDPAFRESLLDNVGTLLPELQAGGGEELTPERLQRISCPITCIVGDLTPEVILSGTDRLARILPRTRIARIDGAAHAIHFDQPQRFVDAVRSAVAAQG
jgi:pimeloyl-ACP methyl ester carboxylesterase